MSVPLRPSLTQLGSPRTASSSDSETTGSGGQPPGKRRRLDDAVSDAAALGLRALTDAF